MTRWHRVEGCRRLGNRWSVLELRKTFENSPTREKHMFPRLAKSKSGYVNVPQSCGAEDRGCLGSYNNVTSALEAQCSSVLPSVLVELLPHVGLCQLKSPA